MKPRLLPLIAPGLVHTWPTRTAVLPFTAMIVSAPWSCAAARAGAESAGLHAGRFPWTLPRGCRIVRVQPCRRRCGDLAVQSVPLIGHASR